MFDGSSSAVLFPEVWDIFSDTVNFFDQLPFEHILVDTFEERNILLQRIVECEQKISDCNFNTV